MSDALLLLISNKLSSLTCLSVNLHNFVIVTNLFYLIFLFLIKRLNFLNQYLLIFHVSRLYLICYLILYICFNFSNSDLINTNIV